MSEMKMVVLKSPMGLLKMKWKMVALSVRRTLAHIVGKFLVIGWRLKLKSERSVKNWWNKTVRTKK
jgi:hypothetical protein